MSNRRVVSLAPSATATLVAAGVGDCLVGVTHHCDAPPGVSPVGSWLDPDYDAIAARDPDVVCTSDALQRGVRDDLQDRGFDVVHHEPTTLSEALSTFESLPSAVGSPDAGGRLRTAAETRLDAIREAVAGADRPVVYCEEWSDPPMAAGNWVPDAVRVAGGRCPFVDSGDRSREVDRETVLAADPDHVVFHICGHGDRVSPDALGERGWDVDAATHVVDDDLLNQPSPRLIDGIETVARLLHPERVVDVGDGEGAEHADRTGGAK